MSRAANKLILNHLTALMQYVDNINNVILKLTLLILGLCDLVTIRYNCDRIHVCIVSITISVFHLSSVFGSLIR